MQDQNRQTQPNQNLRAFGREIFLLAMCSSLAACAEPREGFSAHYTSDMLRVSSDPTGSVMPRPSSLGANH